MKVALKKTVSRKIDSLKSQNWRALTAYWILGICNNYGYVVMLSAANDILAGFESSGDSDDNSVTTTIAPDRRPCNHVSTGAILLADIIPSLIIKTSAPFLPFFIHIRMVIAIGFAAGGLLMVAFAEEVWLAVLGVVVTSFSSGLGEATLLQYSSFYSKNVISTWSSGTGMAGILGAVSYTGLIVLGIRNALLLMLIVPLLMAISFWILLTKPEVSTSKAVHLDVHAAVNLEEVTHPLRAIKKKFFLLPGLLKYMIPLGLVYLFEYFINQGTFELVNFEGIFITPSEQYRWLQVTYQIGVFVSRSSVNLFHIRQLWILCVLQLINVGLFTSEVVTYFIPNVWIVFALTLWEGLLGGASYVNTYYRVSKEVPEERKQFSISATSMADSVGITIAGLVSLPVHNAICDLPKPVRAT